MAAGAHLYEIFVRAPRETVWNALTDPDHTVRYFHATRIESSFRPGEKWRLVRADDDADAVEGEIETFDPPHRLVMTWRVLDDSAMSEEPPSRVEWTLTPANDDGTVTRVTLRHGDLALSPHTWAHVRLGWVGVLDSLKSYLETGEPLPAVDTDEPAVDVEGQWHRAEAIAASNSAWELLDGRDLGPDEVDQLLERAYAASHHWRRATGATVVNRARAAYLLSRAHACCGHGGLALHHADQCSDLVSRAPDDMADFDDAYVYEARARALACLGRVDEAREAHRRAATVRIRDSQDRAIFDADLAAGPWFGLDT
ncbi:MAG TPA: SRPBCC family protein [Ilumatobacter sp.]|nr:SRPBCC family protein [Ilumatobacter sp.]